MSAVLSRSSAEAVELPQLLAVVAELTATDLGRSAVLALRPLTGRAELVARRRRAAEVELLLRDGSFFAGLEEPLAPLLERLAARHGELGGVDLVRLAGLLEATAVVIERVAKGGDSFPALAELCRSVPRLTELRTQLRKTFDRRGRIRDDATPALARAASRARKARDGLYKSLQGLVGKYKDHLSEETIPLREGRLVLMLSSGARGRIDGLVHGRSATGKSYYFEPLEVVEANNGLQQAIDDQEAERQRILNELIETARAELPSIRRHGELAATIDTLAAGARFAGRCRGRLADLADEQEIALVEGRHPLLDPDLADLRERALGEAGHSGPVVPLDIELDAETRALVVTGPNAGGKTVALKTVGLLTMASQCGLPVPVGEGTRLPFVERSVVAVGDEQDLLTDRSTFSGRLLRLDEAWRQAGDGSLVLIDELGSGTDPVEGAALGVALTERLVEAGGLALITTHLTQLAMTALDLPGAACAAMQFDSDSGEPTYRFQSGPPGGSEALALARRLGLPAAWLDRAAELLGDEQLELRRMLEEISSLRSELATERSELAAARRRAEQGLAEIEREKLEIEGEKKRVGRRLKQELEAFREQVTAKLRDEAEAMRAELETGRRKRVAAKAAGRLFADAPELVTEEPEVTAPPEVGGRVKHRSLGWEGVVERLAKGRAEVVVSGKRLRCAVDELVSLGAASGKAEKRRRRTAKRPAADELAGGGERELHLLGRQVEESLEEIDRFLDRALLDDEAAVRIVHGHGTGRLRKAVREHLRRHPAVDSFRPGGRDEGGDGATVVALRG